MLNGEEIRKLIEEKGIIKNYCNLDIQITPNGFDVTVEKIFEFDSSGALDFSNSERVIPKGKEVLFRKESPEDKYGWWKLKKGAYKIRTNEIFDLPKDLMAISFSRSSLLRMGAFVQNGVWDAGFKGKSEMILVVENPKGIKLKENARITQVIFIEINKVKKGYQGIYLEKNLN